MDFAALLQLPPNGLVIFLLVLVRSSSIFLTAPVLGNANVPARVKMGLALTMALIFTPLLLHQPLAITVDTPFALATAVLQEIAVGVLIGMIAQLVFTAVQFAGQSVGMQMGFGMSVLFDPMTHAQISAIAQFYVLLAALVFLLIDGHHWLLIALDKSFQGVPLGTFVLDGRVMGTLLYASNELFWTALMVMAPVLGVLSLTELALGIVARIMPQMNIFMAAFPVKIFLGMLTLIFVFPLMTTYMAGAIEQTFGTILKLVGP